MLKKIISSIGILIVAFFLFLYLTIRTIKTDVSTQIPFSLYVGNTATLYQGGRLVRLLEQDRQVADWIYFDLPEKQKDPGQRGEHQDLAFLKSGTKVKIISAHMISKGVSGLTQNIVKLQTQDLNNNYIFEFHWGADPDILNKEENGERNFAFKPPPWDPRFEPKTVKLKTPKRFIIF